MEAERNQSYTVPLNRPSFHRIIKSFIQLELGIHQREAEEALSTPSIRPLYSASALPISIASRHSSVSVLPELPNLSHNIRMPDAAIVASNLRRPSISSTSPRNSSIARSIRTFRSIRTVYPPPTYQRRQPGTRASNGDESTEGSVDNPDFVPEAMHGDIGLRYVENWYLPFWERYKP